MDTDNFVFRLEKADLLEFANEYLQYGSDLKFVEVSTIISNYEGASSLCAYFQTAKSSNTSNNILRILFCQFYYVKDLFEFGEYFIFSPANEYWRAFMAQKYGEEYVNAYKEYVDVYITNKRRALENLSLRCYDEIKKLSDINIRKN